MKGDQTARVFEIHSPALLWRILPVVLSGLVLVATNANGAGVVLWDTGVPIAEKSGITDRTGWTAVPAELFAFEADPLKAASDPGYYGREYSFKGDAVVQNQHLTVVFASASGHVLLYSNAEPSTAGVSPGDNVHPGPKIAEIVLLIGNPQAGRIRRVEVLRNIGDEVVLEVAFAAEGSPEVAVDFAFGRDEIVGINPRGLLLGIRLLSPIEYGVVPGFIGDDLIFGPAEFGSSDVLHVPAESVFVGLLSGGDSELVMTWPKGGQRMALTSGADSRAAGRIESVDFSHDGESLYLAVLSAPGIWHREPLTPSFLEKDVALAWKPPFPARWKTQLLEAGLPTTFHFRDEPSQIWRGVPGSYQYPVWIDDGTAFYHLSKKVPPKGESVVYFLEGLNTPLSVSTPVDILKATLGRQAADSILDFPGRKLRTHHRRGGEGVHRACTCGCTEAIQAIFEAGQEAAKRDEVRDALDDMNFFVQRHVERIEEYQRFAGEMIQFLQATAASSQHRAFCEALEPIVQLIPEECRVQQENMKSPDHAADLTRRTLALTAQSDIGNLKAYLKLLDEWRAMGGAQDYVVARCHMIARRLFQEAGYAAAHDPRTVALAQEVRARCRQVLRNPDGYEIWANY